MSKTQNRFEWDVMMAVYSDGVPEFFEKAFSSLSIREKEVIERRFKDHMTRDAIAKEYGITSERIRQIEKKALRKIRGRMFLKKGSDDIGRMFLKKGSDDIESLDLSVRAYNALKRNGISGIRQLSGMSYDEIMHFRNLGTRSFDEINEKLEAHGFKPIAKESFGSWIPVKERLPEKSGKYLVTCYIKSLNALYVRGDDIYWFDGKHSPYNPEREVDMSDYQTGYPMANIPQGYVGWCSSCNGFLFEYLDSVLGINAWMPLPEPYKKGEK